MSHTTQTKSRFRDEFRLVKDDRKALAAILNRSFALASAGVPATIITCLEGKFILANNRRLTCLDRVALFRVISSATKSNFIDEVMAESSVGYLYAGSFVIESARKLKDRYYDKLLAAMGEGVGDRG